MRNAKCKIGIGSRESGLGNREEKTRTPNPGSRTPWFAGLVVFMLVVLGSSFAHAVLTKHLSYQGRLQDASGQPVPNGTYSVAFSIYNLNTGGAPLWTETQNVNVEKGGFSAYLGSVAPLNVPFTEDYFLGIKVGADPEMTPRLKLAVVGASAFALDAGNAGNAANLGGQPPSNYASVGHTHSFGSLTGAVAVAPSATQIIQPASASVIPLGIKGQTGQSVPYFTVEDNAGGKLFSIQPDGHVMIPAANILHLKNLDNDSPAGPMGDISINAINLSGDSKVVISNPDATFKANLGVEGRVLIGNPTVSAAGLSVLDESATNYAARFEINNASNNVPLIFGNHVGTGELIALQKSGATQFAVNNVGNVFLKGDITKTAPAMAIDVRDVGNSVLNITNTSTGTASLQVEGATVVTSVNGVVANPSATQSIIAQNAATTPLSIKSAVSPTAPIFEVLDDAAVRKFAVMPDGHVFIPGNNQLHVLNVNNDSPTGAMGNMVVDVMDATADSKLILQNSDPSFNANLAVEGKVLVGAPTTTNAKVSAEETGTGNKAGVFTINNALNTKDAVYVTTNGTGIAGNFLIANASNSNSLLFGNTTGTGNLLQLQQGAVNKFVVANNGNLLVGNPTTTTAMVSAYETGIPNYAGYFEVNNASNAAYALYAITNSSTAPSLGAVSTGGGESFVAANTGTGRAARFQISNAGNSSTLIFGNITSGTGNLLQLQQGGVNKFVVSNAGNLTLNGNILAFNGVNSVPVTAAAAQQLIQFGSASGTCPFNVNFPTAFTGIPVVTATKTGGGAISFATQTINSSSFQIVGCGAGSQFHWIAIGDK